MNGEIRLNNQKFMPVKVLYYAIINGIIKLWTNLKRRIKFIWILKK